MNYRLLALDIDGTLVNSADEVSPASRALLGHLAAAGFIILLATGRRYSRALPVAEDLGLKSPLVTSSGALIKNPLDHATLYRTPFCVTTLREVITTVHDRGFPIALLGDTFEQGFDFYVFQDGPTNSYMENYLQSNAGSERFWESRLEILPEGILTAFSLGTFEEMKLLAEVLHTRLPGCLTTNVLRSPKYEGFFCEIMPSGTNKWSAVLWLADRYQIRPCEICAIGDDVNDLAMIAEAGLGIAMGNAPPEVKAAADWVAPSHEEDGLTWALEQFMTEAAA